MEVVLRLVNFATDRWAETEPRTQAGLNLIKESTVPGLDMVVGGTARRWIGDISVFRWHHDWPHSSSIIRCAMMALERWLYDRIDAGEDVTTTLDRIFNESRSLAFAGLLIDVGKRYPQLFRGPLYPLLTCHELYEMDNGTIVERAGGNAGVIAWSLHPPGAILDQAREWFSMPHRRRQLQDIAVKLLLTDGSLSGFFAETRASWAARLTHGQPFSLRCLIARFTPDCYTFKDGPGVGRIATLVWPADIQKQIDADQPHKGDRLQLLTLPLRCRQCLANGQPMPQDELPAFWELLRRFAQAVVSQRGQASEPVTEADGLAAGIAVLLSLHRAWLDEDPSRRDWCRQQLEAMANAPPQPHPLDDAGSAIGNTRWDSFLAECGCLLLAENPLDTLARRTGRWRGDVLLLRDHGTHGAPGVRHARTARQ